jgi:hypothetical protein
MSLTLNQIVKRLQNLAVNHKQVKSFFFGPLAEWLANPKRTYTACAVDLLGSNIDRAARQTRYRFDIWFFDLTNVSEDSRGNETEVLSDLSSIAEDMLAMMGSHSFEDWEVTGGEVGYFTEHLEDWTAAVKLSVTVSVDFLADRCRVPSELTFES